MRMTIEIKRPRRSVVALSVGLVILAAPALALASHQFSDVPTGHPFHAEISEIAGAGITAGFNDGTYRPGDAVTRQAMAAFMARGFSRHAMSFGAPLTLTLSPGIGESSAVAVPVREIVVNVPGASSTFLPSQIVYLHGRVTLESSMSTTTHGCPCTFEATVRDEVDQIIFLPQYQSFESATTGIRLYSFDVDAFFEVPPGQRTFTLEVGLFNREGTTNAVDFGIDDTSSLTAMTFPFSAEFVTE